MTCLIIKPGPLAPHLAAAIKFLFFRLMSGPPQMPQL